MAMSTTDPNHHNVPMANGTLPGGVGGLHVRDFFRGKTVLVTGGSGFLGKALVAKLLRDTQAKRVVLLLRSSRPKKGQERGMSPRERLEEMLLTDAAFEGLTEEDKKSRVCAMRGDVSMPGLGVDPEEEREAGVAAAGEGEVVVFHSAATVRFDEPMPEALRTNVEGTREVLRLCNRIGSR